MKKLFALFIVPALSLAWVSASFAEEVEGTVQSFDGTRKEVVLKEASGGLRAVVVHEKVFPSVKIGSKAKAVLQPGSNKAETFSVEVE